MKRPEYQREGWRPAGPGGCRCPKCGATVTTNALGRASHRRACQGWQAERAAAEQRKAARREASDAR